MKPNEEKEWSRDTAQGSIYDHMYFTDDELKQGEEINRQAQEGKITWDSAHNWWQNKRAGYGYDGGEDGHGFTTLADQAKNDTVGYTGRYQNAMDQAANAILNRKAFSYDAESDPMYQQYKDSYTRQGKQAMEDTLTQVSARTGGLASSYAGTAAQQTYDGYMAALADKVPELRQLAYQMYMDEGNTMRQDLQLLQGLDATEYGRYRDGVADSQWRQQFDYNAAQDAIRNDQWQQNFDRGVFESDRNYEYGVGRDAVEDSRYESDTASNKAMALLESGAMPSAEMLTAAGMTAEQAAAILAVTNAKNAKMYGMSNGGSEDSTSTTKTPVPKKDPEPKEEPDDNEEAERMQAVMALGVGQLTDDIMVDLINANAVYENADGLYEWNTDFGWDKTNWEDKLAKAKYTTPYFF